MTMKKKILTTLSVVLILGLAALGILAYLQSEDSDVNVMTLGEVKIEQIEQERNDKGELVDFAQGKPLYPYVGEVAWNDDKININGHDYNMFGDKLKNAVDKIITVKNTGKSDAYVRTIVAIEDPFATSMLGINVGGVGYTQSQWMAVTIDGTQYSVTAFTYDEALEPNENSLPSLLQVYLKNIATNEDVALLGDTFEIRAISQAVQTEGFDNAKAGLDEAFGDVNENNVIEWFTGMKPETNVDAASKMQDALKYSGVVNVTKDIATTQDTVPYFENIGKNIVINGKEHALKSGSAAHYSNITRNGGSTTYKDVEIVSNGGGVAAAGGAKVTFNSGSVYVDTPSTSGRYIFYAEGAGSEITINGGEFSWDPADNQKRAYIYAGEGTTVYVNGGTFGKASTRDGYTAGIMGSGTVIIKGGTFGFDPSAWVADGYKAVNNGTTWTVEVE